MQRAGPPKTAFNFPQSAIDRYRANEDLATKTTSTTDNQCMKTRAQKQLCGYEPSKYRMTLNAFSIAYGYLLFTVSHTNAFILAIFSDHRLVNENTVE